MLSLTLTPNALGVRLSGTSDDLMALCDAAYDILPENHHNTDEASDIVFAWGLGYEAQQAARGNRIVQKIKQPVIEHSTVMVEKTIYAVDILIPMFIAQMHIIYCYCDDYNFRQQHSPFILQSVMELLIDAIEPTSKEIAALYTDWCNDAVRFNPDYLVSHIYNVASAYIQKTGNRLEYIPQLLNDLPENSDAYNATMKLALRAAQDNNCHPSQVAFANAQEIFHKLDNGQYPW